jgi:hypothetical protein
MLTFTTQMQSMIADNSIADETEIECYPTPELDKDMKGIGWVRDDRGTHVMTTVKRKDGRVDVRYTQLTAEEMAEMDLAQEYKIGKKARKTEDCAAGVTRSGKRRKGQRLGDA